MQLVARLQQLKPCDLLLAESHKIGGLLIPHRLRFGLLKRLVGEQQLQTLRAIVHDFS
jgi:hypothetical protein